MRQEAAVNNGARTACVIFSCLSCGAFGLGWAKGCLAGRLDARSNLRFIRMNWTALATRVHTYEL
jgi:hypothetical protein